MPSPNESGISSSSADPSPEFDRVAVVAIEGGGVFGMSMLGQLSAVLEAGIVPGALSGTSAGAVVATLVWAGYSPKEVRDIFVELAGGSSTKSEDTNSNPTLVDLIGPFDPPIWVSL